MCKPQAAPLRAGRDDKRRDDSSEREAVPVQQLLSPDEPPFPLSSRPKRSAVERSAVSAVLSWKCFSAVTHALEPRHQYLDGNITQACLF
jgi:hypothetical protein